MMNKYLLVCVPPCRLDTAVNSPVADMVETVTKGFNTEEELEELEDFYDTNFDIVRAFSQCVTM